MKQIIMILALFMSICVYSQNVPKTTQYVVNKHGELVEKKDTLKTKAIKEDPVYKVINGRTFYKGPKGGIYEWKVNKKTGKKYKAYLQKEE